MFVIAKSGRVGKRSPTHFFLPRRLVLGLALLLAAGFLAGCGTSDSKPPKFVVAKGKGIKVVRADLDKAEAQFFQQRGVSKAQTLASDNFHLASCSANVLPHAAKLP